MKYIKKWKIFETITVKKEPTIYEILTHQTTFEDREFNPLLLTEDFIEGVKQYLYDLSEEDNCDVEISFTRTIPQFKIKRTLGATDLLIINIKPQENDWWRTAEPGSFSLKTQATKRNYINKEILEDTAFGLENFAKEYDLEVGICWSYLPFSSVETYFKYRSNLEHLTDVTIILFKSETPT